MPIVEQSQHLLGIVSEYDLLKAIQEEKPLVSVTARDLMTSTPIAICPETPAMDIIQMLEGRHLIRMPVVNQEGQLVGIVARRDILKGYVNTTRETRVFF